MAALRDEEKNFLGKFLRLEGPDADRLQAEALHSRYGRLIHYLLKLACLPEESHEELFNQIFLKILRGIKKIRHFENLTSWVSTITRNEIRSYLRHLELEVRSRRVDEDSVIYVRFGLDKAHGAHLFTV